MRKRLVSAVLPIAVIMLCFASCGGAEPEKQSDSDKLKIVCSIFPQYDFCRNIAGDRTEVELLLDSKTDLHSFEPTAEDILKISKCDLFINVGGESDEWAEDIIRSSENKNLSVISIMDLVNTHGEETLPGMEENEEESGEPEADEHVWTSLKNAVKITEKITRRLCELDAENADFYSANCKSYTAELISLEKEYQSVIGSAKRSTLLFADRFPFRYLAEDYSLECFAAFSGCSAQTEASFETMAFLAQTVKDRNLPFVLVIDGSDGSVAEAVSRQSGAKIKTLNSCQSVPEQDIKNGVGYLEIMRQNLEVLKEVLN